ncbi:stealth family protein [Scandinavium manionii]|uniref:stealth family protein n=1 Tax=Scandinavium manionii TaxID=2926520 RepID=UPI002165ED34|nr:stealth family protein [Scandinavium manionii]MCS2150038.1 stealth family protein [Scandinavium manionii]
MSEDNRIDIVIPWVDGNDALWMADFNVHKPKVNNENSHEVRFRDWDLMRFWFRGIEENMPWVRKIHFITYGHIPAWLNTKHEKINIVKHEDYIPQEYLPTFSSHVIEIFIHKIEDLAEKFIYFNDDLFAVGKIDERLFFENNFPKDTFAFNVLGYDNIAHIIMNDVKAINYKFSKKEVVLNNLWKIFNWRYLDKAARSLLLSPWPHITGFYNHHLPQAYLKDTFKKVWNENEEILIATANNKFRSNDDVNQYLFRYWQLCSGTFRPFSLYKKSSVVSINDQNFDSVNKTIKDGTKKIICINDGEVTEFEKKKKMLHQAFNTILPKQSSFEIVQG